MKQLVKDLYFRKYIRLPVKILIMVTIFKTSYDFYQYKTLFRSKRPQPRFCFWDQQSPANHYMPVPYPWYKTYDEYMQRKKYYFVQNQSFKSYSDVHDKYFLYVDLPCRQNPNAIDQLLNRITQYSCSQKSKYYLLNQLAKKQGSVPQGVYQQIRLTREHELQIQQGPIIPKL